MSLPIHTPDIPIPASTVILVRDRRGSLEVYLLKRSGRSDFMPGLYVFPGGTLNRDDQDPDFWKSRIDMAPEEAAFRFGDNENGLDLGRALAHGVAGIRETFEEAGVLLVRGLDPDNGAGIGVCERRLQGALPGSWLREWVVSGRRVLTLSALAPWSHWITPTARTRRYDTRFFLTLLPEGQSCVPDQRETTQGVWTTPEAALAGNLAGTIPLSPPTLVTLQELLPYSNLASLKGGMGDRTWGQVRVPRLIPLAEGAILLLPWDPDYENEAFTTELADLKVRDAVSERPVSRIGYVNGRWLPLSP